ncbi:hypothetical protein [Falsiroseomonas oryziterrae]|uniref:hypothetical protein n=1 Tax=Falsiroseomonas oryziterrae TaxID=2911368 RepID=UPI001F3D8AEB|nr:hypothetical protein [Roseomonas sp. NPKOSM-4]
MAFPMMRPGVDHSINQQLLDLQGATFGAKLEPVLRLFGFYDAFSVEVLDEVRLFTNIRNRTYHYQPEPVETNLYPVEVIALIDRLNLPKLNASWVSYMGDLRVLDWARGVVQRFVSEFDRCAGRPFSTIDWWEGRLPPSDPAMPDS